MLIFHFKIMQGDLGGKVDILGADIIGHFKKNVNEHVSDSE